MRKSIATVSLSGLLADKLTAIADAGFDGVEVFDNDLVASPMSPREVAARCAGLGLAVELFQPLRDIEGRPPERGTCRVRRTVGNRPPRPSQRDAGASRRLRITPGRPAG